MLANTKYSQILSTFFFVALGIALLAVNFRWIYIYRFDQLLDIDEAGYISSAIAYAGALENGGIIGWFNALAQPTVQAPFTPGAASLLMAAFGNSENIALLTNSIIEFLLCIAVFFTGKKLSGPTAGIWSAILVATTPDVINYARNFEFALPTALFFTLAVLTYLHSDGFKNRRASMAVGAALAFMILSRTMSLAFLPAFAVMFLFDAFLLQKGTKVHVKNALFAIAAFVIIAMPWFWHNKAGVFGYLFSFGYGAHASEYGSNVGIFTFANLMTRLNMLLVAMRLVHFLIVATCLLIYLAMTTINWRDVYADRKKHKIFMCAMLAFMCLFILATSRNRGSGFEVPILPTLIISAVCGVMSFIKQRYVMLGLYIVVSIGCVAVALSETDFASCRIMPLDVHLPVIGRSILFDCRGTIHQYIDSIDDLADRETRSTSAPPLSYHQAREWRQLSIDIADQIEKMDAKRQLVIFASRQFLFNVNTVNLEEIKHVGEIWPATQIDPNVMENTVPGYTDWLQSKALNNACFVILLNNNDGEFLPHPDIGAMKTALEQEKYGIVYSTPTPWPNQHVDIWKKDSENCQ